MMNEIRNDHLNKIYANLNKPKWPSLGKTKRVSIPIRIDNQLTDIINQFDRLYDVLGDDNFDIMLNQMIQHLTALDK